MGELVMGAAPPPAGGKGTLSEIWPWLVVLIIVVLVGGIVVGCVRRWMRPSKGASTVGFTLSDLRTLHAQGRITEQELHRAEQAMFHRVRQDALSEAPGASESRSHRTQGLTGTEKDLDSAPEDAE
jgi:hypothetical protein